MRSPLVSLVTLAAFLLLVVPPQTALADGDDATVQAKQRFESGRAAYLAGDYATAINEFQAAQALRPSPILDYNIGLAYEGLGDAGNAYASYQRYLTAKPDAQNRAEVEQRMAALAKQLQAPPASTGPAVTQPAGPDPYGQPTYIPPARKAPAPAKKKSSNWWVVFPIIGGVVLTGVIIWAIAANTPCGPPDCNGTYLKQPLASTPSPSSPNPTFQLAPAEVFRF